MTPESEATSPASTQPGDGKKTAANVTADQAIARFLKNEQPAETAKTADTEAPAPQGEATADPAAEPAQADSPDAQATPEPEAEATAETKGEGEAEADAVLSPENSNLDPKTKEKIQRRIDKEVGKRKALEAQVELLQREISAVKQTAPQAPPPTPSAPVSDPMPDIKDANALTDYKKMAKQALREAEAILENDEIDWTQGYRIGDQFRTKADIRAMRQNARVALEDTIPAKEEFLRHQTQQMAVRQQAQEVARKTFPWLSDQSSERFKLAAQAWQAIPAIQSQPNAEYLAALLALGQETLLREQQAANKPAEKTAAAKPAAPKQKAPSDQAAATTTGTVTRTNPEAASRSALAAEMDKLKAKRGASHDAAVEFLTKRDQLRHQR